VAERDVLAEYGLSENLVFAVSVQVRAAILAAEARGRAQAFAEAASLRLQEEREIASLRRATSGPSYVAWSWYTYVLRLSAVATKYLRARAREEKGE
jgi:hypothetical protein